MKWRIWLGLLLLVVAAVACNPVKVYLEKDEVKADRKYDTFVIINQYQGKEAWNSPMLDKNLREGLAKGMEERGYKEDAHQPDLILRYNTLLSEGEKEVRDTDYYGMSPYGMYNPYMYRSPYGMPYWPSSTEIEKYNLGEVVIDFIDPMADEVILRISAVGEVNNVKQKYKNIDASVSKILNEFFRNMPS
ncbi:DUF4136 domain-containing protein [Echinicola strongylocentroti]|uniref:DUF4136 domain-containing protein n=1 Tax=Echinicola strongylocentroti TaxID=1795355 RepID=A0A2Z4IP76_9BACT|nr:DUF4136 domain-containing protein [Echinicola strongylocentroti]AWW32560.1 DUF4136 domain-containing protein [Echinicola strongylocentroti]